jgi:hypothetical protein
MGCGCDRLAERVCVVIGQDPPCGHLFVFGSRRGDRLKLYFGIGMDSFCGASGWKQAAVDERWVSLDQDTWQRTGDEASFRCRRLSTNKFFYHASLADRSAEEPTKR